MRFTDAKLERESIRDKFDLLLGITAEFEVIIDDRLLYRELLFPIVELRAQLELWLEASLPRGEDFEFQSMESDEPGFLWFRFQEKNRWRIGSIYQEYPELRTLTDEDISNIINKFIHTVDAWVQQECHIEISEYLR
ncbi:MAG: hypothetical protein ACRDQ4_04800 [Pseudonocardiaceae bacterium]